MKKLRTAVLIAGAVALSGCYHAVIDTGRPASTDMITIKWANSFIYGLVPPPMVNSATKCPNGVSKVETQHSFLNGLVAAITWGIYTPIQIDVTCASR
jgi:Bor protein